MDVKHREIARERLPKKQREGREKERERGKEKEEKRIWEKEHPGEKYPNEWVLSLDAMVSEDDGESTLDRDAFLKDQNASRFYDPGSDAATDRLREIIHDLPPRQKKVIRLIWYVGYNQTETAKLLHCSKANICKLQKAAFEKIRNDETLRKIIYRQG